MNVLKRLLPEMITSNKAHQNSSQVHEHFFALFHCVVRRFRVPYFVPPVFIAERLTRNWAL